MNVCFWCKQQIGEGEGDPIYANYEYCDDCQKHIDKGITIVQVEETQNGNPPIKDDLYPNGKWVVITEKSAKKLFEKWVALPEALVTRHVFMNEETWKAYKLPD
jgi:hypothetical protein